MLFIRRRRSHERGFDITSMRTINMKWSVSFKNLSITVQQHQPNLHIAHTASNFSQARHKGPKQAVIKHSNKILQCKNNKL